MKKARIFILLLICVTLFLTSISYAKYSDGYYDTDAQRVEATNPETIKITTTSSGTTGEYIRYKSYETSFSVKEDGVYLLTVTTDGTKKTEDLPYDLVRIGPNGREESVRLAAFKSGYGTYENLDKKKDGDTTTDVRVILEKGYTYKIKAIGYDNAPDSAEMYISHSSTASGYFKSQTTVGEYTEYNEYMGIYSSTAETVPENSPYYISEDSLVVSTEKAGGKDTDVNGFELSISNLLLAVGDFFVNLLNRIIGKDVTITRLVFNDVKEVDVNFFKEGSSGIGGYQIGSVVVNWFIAFRNIAFSIYVICLLAVGIRVMLNSTSNGIAKFKELIFEWLKGIILLFGISIFMKLVFFINETLVEMIKESSSAEIGNGNTGTSFSSEAGEWSNEEIEFRSPEYVSIYTGTIVFGGEEATKGYVRNISNYRQNFDLMRIMRAYAGLTKKLIYVLIWYILIGQLITFIVMYYKRYFMVAFLVAVFPIVCIFHSINLVINGKKGQELNNWMREFVSNVCIQFVHAVIFTIITGICINIVKEDMNSGLTINWILIIVAINFVPEGEKVVRKMIKAVSSGGGDLSSSAGTVRSAFTRGRDSIQRMVGGKPPKEVEKELDEM